MPEGKKLTCTVAIRNHCVVGDLVEDITDTAKMTRDGDRAIQHKSGRIFIISKAVLATNFEPFVQATKEE
jgi:hypothetical protein